MEDASSGGMAGNGGVSTGGTGGAGTSGGAAGNGGVSTGGAGGSGPGGGSGGTAGIKDSASGCENCAKGRLCCGGRCVNPTNDPKNCGECGTQCTGDTPFCDGTCQRAPCSREASTCAGSSCCAGSCCASDQICCAIRGPVDGIISCVTVTPAQPSCPLGCAPDCISDRNLKRDVVPVERQSVLESVSRLPIATWAYKDDMPDVRHLGPMAQDFRAIFGLGDSDRSYHPIDAHGVALASIQALYDLAKMQNHQIEQLARENDELRRRVDCIENQTDRSAAISSCR